MKVAIIADWLTSNGGAEKVVQTISEIYPDADIYTSVYNSKNFPFFKDKKIYTSFLQKIPFAVKKHQLFSVLRKYAFESFDLSAYDLVISSSHAESKGVITKPHTLHICYCHTPTRYYWSDYHQYFDRLEFGFLNPIARLLMPKLISDLRIWDRLAADRVDFFIANSNNVAKRISKYYKRESQIIYPPVFCSKFNISKSEKKYYLTGGRLIPYKKVDIVIQAFNQLKKEKLIVFGTGPQEKYLKKIASKNIEFVGKVSDDEISNLFANCKAYIFPQEEDFGIVAVEAMASGRPVIAYRSGGALETIKEGITGVFFNEQTPQAIVDAIQRFDYTKYNPEIIRKHALNFDVMHFKKNFQNFVDEKLQQWKKNFS